MFDQLELTPPIQTALTRLGIDKPTAVQTDVMPLVMAGKDVLAAAPTGSGKTVAFVLPLIQQLQTRPSPDIGTRVLILVPTRELARQIQSVCESLGQPVDVLSQSITGGASFKEQDALLRKVPDIVIATPGRLVEHLNRRSIDLKDLKTLVLDEADRMLDMGFHEDVSNILGQCPAQRQTLLFSATLDQAGINQLVREGLNEPETVQLTDNRTVPDNITQQYVLADDPDFKIKLTQGLVQKHPTEQIIIFTNTIARAQSLQARLSSGPDRCAILHGDLTQEARNAVVSGMRDGRYRILVTTDVAARGLDLPNVGLVINFNLARKGDEYLHRVGRTGRAGQPGLAICLIGPDEWNRMISIQNYLSVQFKRTTVPGLTARYRGPEKMRGDGKAYGKKKPGAGKKRKLAEKAKQKDKNKDKPKERLRDRKNQGKRRSAPENSSVDNGPSQDGLRPLKRKPRPARGEQVDTDTD